MAHESRPFTHGSDLMLSPEKASASRLRVNLIGQPPLVLLWHHHLCIWIRTRLHEGRHDADLLHPATAACWGHHPIIPEYLSFIGLSQVAMKWQRCRQHADRTGPL